MSGRGGYLERPAPSGLADVVDVIVDRGVVVDAYLRVNLLGIELMTVDARIVVASVDTYLRFAEATNRLELESKNGRSLTDLVTEAGGNVVEHVAEDVVAKKIEPVGKPVREAVDVVRTGVEKVKDAAEDALGIEDDTGTDDRGDDDGA